jgi:hypothetical protein
MCALHLIHLSRFVHPRNGEEMLLYAVITEVGLLEYVVQVPTDGSLVHFCSTLSARLSFSSTGRLHVVVLGRIRVCC